MLYDVNMFQLWAYMGFEVSGCEQQVGVVMDALDLEGGHMLTSFQHDRRKQCLQQHLL